MQKPYAIWHLTQNLPKGIRSKKMNLGSVKNMMNVLFKNAGDEVEFYRFSNSQLTFTKRFSGTCD